jgi:hypothetical protein
MGSTEILFYEGGDGKHYLSLFAKFKRLNLKLNSTSDSFLDMVPVKLTFTNYFKKDVKVLK